MGYSVGQMRFATEVLLPVLGIFVGMLACLELGRRIGLRRRPPEGAPDEPSATTVDTAIFALFGLLIAFTYSGATNRFDHRRDQIVIEANAIGTAYLRVDLLPTETRAPLQALFRDYVRARLETFRRMPDEEAARAQYDRGVALHEEIWKKAVPVATATGDPAVLSLVVSSLNDMADIASERLAATRIQVPLTVLGLLYGLALATALVVGRENSSSPRRWFRTLLFPLVISASIFIILDLEHPRFGVINLEMADQILVELLDQMK